MKTNKQRRKEKVKNKSNERIKNISLDFSGKLSTIVNIYESENPKLKLILNELLMKMLKLFSSNDGKSISETTDINKEKPFSFSNNEVVAIYRCILSVLSNVKGKNPIVGSCRIVSEKIGFYGQIKEKLEYYEELDDEIIFDEEFDILEKDENPETIKE